MTATPAPSAQEQPWTVLRILRWTQSFFAEKQIEDARRDAEILLGHTLGLSRVQLFTHFDRPLSPEERDAFRAIVKRRAQREPVAYIVGTREFWSMPLKVDRRVLIPRPDTECLVEQTRQRAWDAVEDPRRRPTLPQDLDQRDKPHIFLDEEATAPEPQHDAPPTPLSWEAPRRLRVADIGTGSGAIALALARELPYADVLAVDLSQDALDLARENAEALDLGHRITFAQGDLLQPLRDGALGAAPFDLIVSNPPYIPEAHLHDLLPEVARHEPRLALTPGPEGTEALKRLAQDAFDLLRPGGWLLIEIGYDQADAARALFAASAHPWADVRILRDPYSGQHRVVEARRP